jgi:aspartyl-tRNA(Asn)/glutamyl-tRNA(Gln) amidotransferase subunit A
VTDELLYESGIALAGRIRRKEISPVELTRGYLARTEALDRGLRAFITVCADGALDAARMAESTVMSGGAAPLLGVPFAVKDQFDTRGVRTTMGSRLFADHVPTQDATVVARLKRAGAVLLGKLNLTEFALGGTLDFPFGQPRNPWDRERDPGGSSSGSGIAAAAALAAVTLGEDTGGSVRSPASYCGVVGLRPTARLVSRHGCFPLAWSMDAPGPITRTVEDVALLLSIIAGYDERDPLTTRRPLDDVAATLRDGLRGMKLGLVKELTSGPDTDPEVRDAVVAAARVLEGAGAVVEEVSLPLVPLAGAVFMALADAAGGGIHLPWLRERPEAYDAGTRRRLITAALLPAGLQQQAERARALIRDQVLDALRRLDLLVSPTSPRPAPPIAQGQAPVTSKEDAARRFFARRAYTTPYSLTGNPAISLPCGFTGAGLPIGLQLAARPFDERALLRAAQAYEQATPWHTRRPPLP